MLSKIHINLKILKKSDNIKEYLREMFLNQINILDTKND